MIAIDNFNVVEAYVARDKNDSLWLYKGKPIRVENLWTNSNGDYYKLPPRLFSNLKWEDEPIRVEVTIKEIK